MPTQQASMAEVNPGQASAHTVLPLASQCESSWLIRYQLNSSLRSSSLGCT